jgi:pimeloyl-ACP methyl ester carboxylesterase
MTSFLLNVIRGAFTLAEHVAPRLTGRLAFELFCRTPNPSRPSPRERQILGEAEDFMANARLHQLPIASGCVAVRDFRPPSGRYFSTVLVIHGWRSRTEHMRALIEGLLNAGSRVLAIDLPGHGRSQGRRLHMAYAVAAAHAGDEWFGPFDAVIGHSFGGAVAVNAAVGSVTGIEPLRAGRLVLVSAPSSMPAIFDEFGRFLHLGPRTRMALADRVEEIAGQPLHTYVGALQLARRPDLPALVIHAADDKEVSADEARAFAQAGDHVRLVWADGLGHRRILGDPVVVGRAVEFAIDRGAALDEAPGASEGVSLKPAA